MLDHHSLPHSFLSFLFLSLLVIPSLAKVVTKQFNITWVWAAPDGFGRSVIGINGRWPCPEIVAQVGDTITVNVTNLLGNETTGIHWHGINQHNTEDMDGPSGVTQCGIPPNMSVVYNFTADVAGTYWCTCTGLFCPWCLCMLARGLIARERSFP